MTITETADTLKVQQASTRASKRAFSEIICAAGFDSHYNAELAFNDYNRFFSTYLIEELAK